MINWELPEKLISEAFDQLVDEFEQEQIYQLKDPKWQWPRQTIRRVGKYSGRVVNSPRDIVDTETLLNSLTIQQITSYIVLYQYLADYAAYVHFGGTTSKGTKLPARPWIFQAIKDYNLFDSFADILREKLK